MSPLSRVRSLDYELPARAGVSAAAIAIVVAVTVSGLYFAREVLIPLTLAALLSFLLVPALRALCGWRVPRGLAVGITVALALGLFLALGALISSQLATLANDLPRYETTLKEKIRDLRDAKGGASALEKASSALKELGNEISSDRAAAGADPSVPTAAVTQEREARPVILKEAPETPLGQFENLVEPFIGPIAATGLVLLFTIFILLQREDLRDRIIRLLGTGDLNRTTVAINDAAARLSRYFLLQAMLNATFGIFVGLALWAIGIPSPALWGVLAALMRFVPYIGSVIAAVFPIALAAAIDPGWSMVAWTAAVFVIGEPLMGHVVEPLVYGRHTGLSPLAVVAAATFWTWLWGPIGLILATPLTLCLVVIGQHVERLEFLSVLLGDEPALTPAQRFYQRLLAGDGAEVVQQAERSLEKSTLVEYCDQIALPGLRLAVQDEIAGRLDAERISEIGEAVDELIEALDHAEPARAAAGNDTRAPKAQAAAGDSDEKGLARLDAAASALGAPLAPAEINPAWRKDGTILVVPGRGSLDLASARMLARLLGKAGFGAECRGEGGLSGVGEALDGKPQAGVQRVVVATVGGISAAQARMMVRRVQRAAPDVPVVIGALTVDEADGDIGWLRSKSGAQLVATSFAQVLESFAKSARVAPAGPPKHLAHNGAPQRDAMAASAA